MNQPIKTLSLLILFTLVCVSSSYAVNMATDNAGKKGYDKYGNPLPGTKTNNSMPDFTIPKPIPDVELDPVQPANATEVRPATTLARCRDFNYEGDVMRPVRRPAGYSCPPGYWCHLENEDLHTFNCKFSGSMEVYDNPTDCRWSLCTDY